MATFDAALDSQQRMADALLRQQDTDLRTFLEEQKTLGRGYEAIAQELYATTNRTVSVSYQTIKRWLIDFDLQEVS